MYDICVIGGGPAGLTAALYSARAGRSTLLMEEKMFGGQMAETPVIENMPGSPDAEGWELAMRFGQQVMELNVDTEYDRAERLEPIEGGWRVCLSAGGCHTAKKVILAMGVKRRRLGVPGEERLAGRGVGWCAVCDGAFFRGQEVAVVGGGNTALEDALYLSAICTKVYLLVRGEKLSGQETLRRRVRETENIKVCFGTKVQEIVGENKVNAVTVRHGEEIETIPVGAVFVAIGLSPDPALYGGLVETTPEGYIVADEDCRTSAKNLFVAGDLRKKEIRQIVTALADGAVAAELAGRELQVG